MKVRKSFAVLGAVLVLGGIAGQAAAWGNTGHRIVGSEAIRALPKEVPAFLRTPATVAAVGELAREPDRWKGSGKIHDNDRDPAHFIDLQDDGTALGGVSLEPMPPTKEEFDTRLRAGGAGLFKSGYLPYAMVDRYQQIVKDFAYWRVGVAAEKLEKNSQRRAWIKSDRLRREQLIVRDIGEFAHYVGDGSQPMHLSIHYNGWGDFPNPRGFTQDRVHGPFEAAFVHDNVTAADVRSRISAYQACTAPIDQCVVTYLKASWAQTVPFYELYGQGAFVNGDARGKAFAADRIAVGASELRNLIVDAWRASETASVGYPAVTLADVQSGKVNAWDALYGKD